MCASNICNIASAMEPLSVAAGVTGILTAAAQISSLLMRYGKATKHAPVLTQQIAAEIDSIATTLSHLQSFLLGDELIDISRASLLRIEHVVTIISDCVKTFSELEQIVDWTRTNDFSVLNRTKWVVRENDITKLMQRLQQHKASLSLMLNVLNV